MNKQNLILTPTTGMTREEWLAFRQPLTHVKRFLDKILRGGLNPVSYENFWGLHNKEYIYPLLKQTFDSEEWKQFKFPCVGGSEVGAVMGLSPYKSVIELYFEKVGVKPVFDTDNAAMFWGRELEEQIAEKWQYWDGTIEGLIENHKSGNKLRKCRRLNAYVQNKQFPFIFVSLDRVINKQKTDQEMTDEGSLECKTISGWAADMWESGIPVMYVAQLQTQLIACGFEFGEIAILKDGRHFDVLPFDKSSEVCARIISITENFYHLVKGGIEHFLLHTYGPTEWEQQFHYSEIERLAPEPDGSEAYKNYLSERYNQAQEGGVLGGVNEVILARTYKFYGERIKEFETEQTECANRLKAFMKEVSKIDLGLDGSVTWSQNAKGSRTFRVNVKVDPAFVPEKFQANNSVKSMEVKALEHTGGEKEFTSTGKPRKKKAEKTGE